MTWQPRISEVTVRRARELKRKISICRDKQKISALEEMIRELHIEIAAWWSWYSCSQQQQQHRHQHLQHHQHQLWQGHGEERLQGKGWQHKPTPCKIKQEEVNLEELLFHTMSAPQQQRANPIDYSKWDQLADSSSADSYDGADGWVEEEEENREGKKGQEEEEYSEVELDGDMHYGDETDGAMEEDETKEEGEEGGETETDDKAEFEGGTLEVADDLVFAIEALSDEEHNKRFTQEFHAKAESDIGGCFEMVRKAMVHDRLREALEDQEQKMRQQWSRYANMIYDMPAEQFEKTKVIPLLQLIHNWRMEIKMNIAGMPTDIPDY